MQDGDMQAALSARLLATEGHLSTAQYLQKECPLLAYCVEKLPLTF